MRLTVKSILIVDDSSAIRTVTRRFIEFSLGFEVCGEAIDGADAVEKARELLPDLIIIDLQMPRMDGFQAARALRSASFSAPIILFTMFAEVVATDDALEAGIDAVVCKTNLVGLGQRINGFLS
jgi:two-component system chemotaxis response regulator CheY